MQKTDFSKPSEQFRPSWNETDAWGKNLDNLAKSDGSLDNAMKALAAIAAGHGTGDLDSLQRMICRNAMDWLQSLKVRLEAANEAYGAVRILEYSICTANSDGKPIEETRRDMCLVYNLNTISDEDAEDLLRKDRYTLDDRVLVLWPGQVAALFPDRMTIAEEDEDAGKREKDE